VSEIGGLHRYEALVVVHRDVCITVDMVEKRVAGVGPRHIHARPAGTQYGPRDVLFLVSYDALLACMGIETTDFDDGALYREALPKGTPGDDDGPKDLFLPLSGPARP
jgi:hypothetical protein